VSILGSSGTFSQSRMNNKGEGEFTTGSNGVAGSCEKRKGEKEAATPVALIRAARFREIRREGNVGEEFFSQKAFEGGENTRKEGRRNNGQAVRYGRNFDTKRASRKNLLGKRASSYHHRGGPEVTGKSGEGGGNSRSKTERLTIRPPSEGTLPCEMLVSKSG